MDFLQCCKFAEGDSRILSQKIARDTMKLLAKSGGKGSGEVYNLAMELGSKLEKDGKAGIDKVSFFFRVHDYASGLHLIITCLHMMEYSWPPGITITS